MCRAGVLKVLEDITQSGVCSLDWSKARRVADGFGTASGPARLLERNCPVCGGRLPVVRRVLKSESFNLPDVAVYHALRTDHVALALGDVTSATTPMRRPTPEVRAKWQGLMWETYDVAFVDVECGQVGDFRPAQDWGQGDIPDEFERMTAAIGEQLLEARKAGRIPDPGSVATEKQIAEIITPLMADCNYEPALRSTVQAFWWGHIPDLVFRHRRGHTVSFEVKVDEDWDHPICEPLGNLLEHNVVVNIRVPVGRDRLDPEMRRMVKQAEDLLERTGRAKFLYVLPSPDEVSPPSRQLSGSGTSRPATRRPGVPGGLNRGGVLQPHSPGPEAVVGTVEGSDLYHHQSCTAASKIDENRRIWFRDVAAATSAGRKPCCWCG